MSEETPTARRRRPRFSTEVMFLVSVIFCVSLSIIYLSRYSTIRTLKLHEQDLTRKIEELEGENRRLKQNLQNLQTPEGIERLARERLGLVRPEEIVVVPIQEATSPASSGASGTLVSP